MKKMKSLGRIAYETYCEESIETNENWVFLGQSERDTWEAVAQAVVDEHENRKPDDGDDPQQTLV